MTVRGVDAIAVTDSRGNFEGGNAIQMRRLTSYASLRLKATRVHILNKRNQATEVHFLIVVDRHMAAVWTG